MEASSALWSVIVLRRSSICKQTLLTGLILTSAVLIGCEAEETLSDEDCISLIKGIKETPLKHGVSVQGDYYSVFSRTGEEQVAMCLVSQITNTEPVDLINSSPGPHPRFTVGDVSVFMLADMYEIPFTTFLSAEAWSQSGIFEYYRYVETEGAREKITQTLTPIVESSFE